MALAWRESEFGGSIVAVLAMITQSIWYYEVLAENKTVNAVCCLEFFKRVMHSWQGNRKHAGYLMAMLDLITN